MTSFNSYSLPMPVSPWRLSGTVVTTLLNDPAWVEALGPAVQAAPYKAPPKAPVLAIAPRNTLVSVAAGETAVASLPTEVPELMSGASLGIVIGRVACRLSAEEAMAHVAGYLIVNHLEVPDDSPQRHYRPGVRRKCRDGFCALGPAVIPAAEVPQPDALDVQVLVDGQIAQTSSTAGRSRSVAQLIADVSAFMTLYPGDVLTLGASAGAPRAQVGQTLTVHIAGLGSLSTRLVAEGEGQ